MADPSGDPAPQTGTGSSGSSETEAPPFPQPASENPNAAISDFDLTHLELEIDGIRKTFQDWTLEYADRYYPGLDKNVYHIPSVPFFMSSTKATEWDNSSSNDQINHERGVQNLEQEESGSQDQPASACSRSLESESSSDEDILLDGIVLKKGDHYNIPELRKRVPVSDIDKETKLKYDCVREYYVPGYPSRSVTSISLLRPSGRPLYTTIEEGAILTKNGTDDHVDRVSENVQRQTTESPATKHKHPMEVHTGNTLEAQRDFQVKPDLDSGFPTGKDHTIRGDMWHREYTRDSPATRYHPDFKKETQGKAEHTGRPDIWHREYTGDSPDTRFACHPNFKQGVHDKVEEHTSRLDIWHREYAGSSSGFKWSTHGGSAGPVVQSIHVTEDQQSVAANKILVLDGPLNTGNIIGVKAEKLVHGALDQLGKQLGSMVALYNYDLPNYLEKLQQQIGYVKPGKGELDVMVLNLQSGPVLIEVKKANLEDDRTEEEKVRGKKETQKEKKRKRRSVMNLLKEAHHQLTNAEAVFNKVMASHGPLPTVKKVTAVPFLSRDELRRVLDVKPKPAVYASTFMCKDDLTDIGKWWEDHILCKPNPMSLETMRAIVGRFAGLLSTVEVPSLDKKRVEMRTHSDAVNEVGRQMSLILLTKQQAEILQCPDPVVQLCGPAGSGKTLMLGMRAMLWLEQGHVVYLQKNDLAIGCKTAKGEMLETLIKDLCKNRNIPVKNLRILNRLPDDKKQTTASHLLKDHSPQHVHAIFDEIWHKSGNQCTERYLEAMIQQGLSVWFSVPCMDNYTTVDGAKVFKLQAVLRSPPVIQRLLKELEGDLVPEWRDCYSTSGEDTGLTTDGPRIKIIQHSKHILHSQVPPSKCPECSLCVLKVLSELGVPQLHTLDYEVERKIVRADLERLSTSSVFTRSVLKLDQNPPLLMFALSGHKSTEDSTEPGCPKRASRQNMHIGHRDIILLKQSFWASRPRWSEGSGPYSGYGLQKLVFEHGEIAGARMAILKSRGIRMEDHFHVIPSWFGIPLVVCDIPYVSEQVLKTEQGIAVAEEKLAWGIEKKVVIYIMRPDEGNASEKGDETAYHKMEENETLITDKNSSCQVGDVEEVDVVPKTLLDKLSRTQRGMLFVAASRCTSQLVIILP